MSNDILFFSSHFFQSLEENGPNSVVNWTSSRRKNVNVFDKKMIFIIVNKDMHWSLLVLVNPGRVFSDENSTMTNSFILHMDSMQAHDSSKLSHTIYEWLKYEAAKQQKRNDLFTHENMPVGVPDVPMQNNSWDCGVFVCHYLFSMMSLQDTSFSVNKRKFQNKRNSSKMLKEWITNKDSFQFTSQDIVDFRAQLACLVRELSNKESQPEQQQEATKEESVELNRLTVKQLKEKCREKGLKPGNHRKEALIEMLHKFLV